MKTHDEKILRNIQLRFLMPVSSWILVLTLLTSPHLCAEEIVPWVGIASNNDCGVNCLVIASKLLGVNTDKQEIARLAKLGTYGTNMMYLSQAARQKGLYAQGVKWNWNRLKKWPNPAIAHWENHFVLVLGSTKDNQIKILDPPSDPLLMDANSFCKKWDGKALLLSDKPINTFFISLSEHWLLIPVAMLAFLMTLRFVHKYSHKKTV